VPDMQGFHPCGGSIRARPPGRRSVRRPAGVKIIDTFALEASPPYSPAVHKALIAQSNLALTGV